MKPFLLLCLTAISVVSAIAQPPRIRKGIFYQSYNREQPVVREPVEKVNPSPFTPGHRRTDRCDQSGTVTILDLGTSASTIGYSLGTRTMVWADDNLKTVVNIHRMGPGATPAGLSGYLAMDMGLNFGKTQSDWTTQIQVQSSTLAASPAYFDASGYPLYHSIRSLIGR